jgi:hypothetical protein
MQFLVLQRLMMHFLREVGENLSNHQVEVVKVKLGRILCIFSSLNHLSHKHLEMLVEFKSLLITSIPAPGVDELWDTVHNGLNYLWIYSHLPFLADCVFHFLQRYLESLEGVHSVIFSGIESLVLYSRVWNPLLLMPQRGIS